MNRVNSHSDFYRDPSGFIFQQGSHHYRQVNQSYNTHYDTLISSGLFETLVLNNMLAPHQDAAAEPFLEDGAYRILEPAVVQGITYPYEWCFSQLKDADLLTLALIHHLAISNNLPLESLVKF